MAETETGSRHDANFIVIGCDKGGIMATLNFPRKKGVAKFKVRRDQNGVIKTGKVQSL